MDEIFLPVVRVLDSLNALGCSFFYEFFGFRLYIDGNKGDCDILSGLLSSKSNDFAFYSLVEGIEVLYLGD